MSHPDAAATQPEGPYPADGFTGLIRQALFTLTPFFMDGADGDADSACAAARELLASYQIGTAEELQLATECIVFAYAAMDTLRQTRTDPAMPDSHRLRLRNSAGSLSRASHRNRRTLDALRKIRIPVPARHPAAAEPQPQADPSEILQDLTEKIAQHRERMAAAHAQPVRALSPTAPAVPPPFMNREHRRLAELAARREARRAQG
jgi:hypothetical protein